MVICGASERRSICSVLLWFRAAIPLPVRDTGEWSECTRRFAGTPIEAPEVDLPTHLDGTDGGAALGIAINLIGGQTFLGEALFGEVHLPIEIGVDLGSGQVQRGTRLSVAFRRPVNP